MVKKAIDSRIPTLIRNGVQEKKRSFFVIVGDKARNQLPNLHYLMSSVDIKMNKSVLWAYKHKLLGFTSHRKKRENKIKRDVKRGIREANSEDPFELFVSLQNIRYVYYKETENILGNTYGMCILQDFEAITPNILARTIETVEGGGIVVILLKSMTSLKQLYTMTMDIHARYRTEAHNDVVARFNERFILSLGSCENCLVVDDELNVLPISGGKHIKPLPPFDEEEDTPASVIELRELKESLQDVQPAGALVNLAKTVDQAKATLTFVDAIAEKTLRSTVTLTAGRGRGKSAALGIAIAAAIGHGYSNIFITSPSPENLKTLFEFIFKGFDALNYEEHLDYDIIQSTNPAFNNAIVRVNVFKSHRQTIQYIQPSDAHVLGQAELVVIDEAAAIPLPLVKKLIGPYLVFMASTINGYEGTGRSLSLKLIQQLREQAGSSAIKNSTTTASSGVRTLREVSLNEPIRYASGDPVEKWLNKVLCLDATIGSSSRLATKGFPHPSECNLFYINRDTLFSFHPVSEAFLHKVWALYVASHYKNSPNDLQLLSDGPAHQLFVLLPPVDENDSRLPEPLCVVQLALEGQISKSSILNSLASGKRGGGDLIPWVVSQQFQDEEFAGLSGARVIRIATSPEYMGMGYGSRALELLTDYYEGKFADISEKANTLSETHQAQRVSDKDLEKATLATDVIKTKDPRTMPPLLLKLSERRPEALHYLGVSFGLTNQLNKFWKRAKFAPVYLRQTANELTGEHTAIMLKVLSGHEDKWLSEFSGDFHRRFLALLAYEFRSFTSAQSLSIIEATKNATAKYHTNSVFDKDALDREFTPFDLKRLESYANNRLDYHVIVDLLPKIATLYFANKFSSDVSLSSVQQAILLGIGLQKKDIDTVAAELNLPVNQTLAMFAKTTRKVSNYFRETLAKAINEELPEIRDQELDEMDGVNGNAANVPEADEEIDDTADDNKKALKEKQRELINALDLQKFAISQDAEWGSESVKKAASGSTKGTVSLKSTKETKRKETAEEIYESEMGGSKKKKQKKNKH
ncbi:Kre33p [Sugiyamaella lignohabitans]|uniref:RNA cytidine acetyltransferase n=1 Tax=Sugiyamaella lignohabitans TaxID=796027 RepID=A0A161HIL0_9ASCO|nr:Kre33p [Sugiyamaella lignohabitans]ANB12367.1 Kre33p [Sugiyamaella lignohabitans]